MDSNVPQRIVIIGGGAIGCSAAYFLTRHSQYDPKLHHITLLEATRLAGGASGKAGGCVARWAAPACLASLSFDLHAQMAADLNGSMNWGYRRAHCMDCGVEESEDEIPDAAHLQSSNSHEPDCSSPDWVYPGRLKWCDELGNTENTAQVHPYLYTTFIAGQAQSNGVEIIIGSATAINYSDDGSTVHSVCYKVKGSEIVRELSADQVIVAAGPWTSNLLPKVPVGGARSHSIVMRVPSAEIPADILFFKKTDPDSWFPRLEVYPRPDDTTYACGPTDFRVPLPASTDLVEVDKESCKLIRRGAESLSSKLTQRELVTEQACYRPVVTIPGRDRSEGPLLGKTRITGLILATGHDNWGIQNSPVTGKIISELVFDGKALSADISSLAPGDVV